MRRVEFAFASLTMLGASLLLLPLVDGILRVRLDRVTHRTLVLAESNSRTCVAHWQGSLCLPLWAYPAFVPGWYADALRR